MSHLLVVILFPLKMVLYIELATSGDYELAQIGSNPFRLGQPLQTHPNFFFLNARERGKKIYISQNSPTLGASCYALKSSNPTVESDGEILFNGLLLTASASILTATAGHLTANSNHQTFRI